MICRLGLDWNSIEGAELGFGQVRLLAMVANAELVGDRPVGQRLLVGSVYIVSKLSVPL
jgi:hypothetical protein